MDFFKKLLQSGMMPNSFTFPSVLRASTNLEAVELGKQIHACIVKKRLESDVFVGSGLVTMYSKCGIIGYALQVMNKMSEPDLGLWNAMISGFVQNGRMEEARDFFLNLAQPNVVSWTSMIAGCAQNGYGEDALFYFIEMLRTGVNANELTLTSVLRACATIAALEQGKQVHTHIYKTTFNNNIFVNNALITMYAKSGSIEDADQIFTVMPERDVISWNAIIAGYAQHGHAKEALILFERLLQAGTKPNEITFLGVLSACCHAGLVDKGWHYFDSMVQNHCLTAGPEHYACMVDLLGRAGCLNEAENLINQMPMKPDAVIWGSLLSACKTHVNVELGKLAAEHLFELEPGNESTHVLLSSIYSAASMWDDARNVRIMMNEKRIKKTPGCSWMHIKHRVHVFVTGDKTHPESERIYEKLNELAKRMEQAGYKPETNFVLEDEAEETTHSLLT